MATELGKAYVQIIPSAKGIGEGIQKELNGETSEAGEKAGGSLVGKLKGVIAAAAIGKFIGDSINEGGKLQQSLGGVETLFKDNADKVKQYAAQAYKTTGQSANDYMENVTGFSASLLQSLGGDTAKAAEVANMAMVDMSDNYNKMGTSMESIQTAYQGFAKQNYTMLDNLKLGYGGTKSEMERLLADATKLTGVKYDINNLSDVYNAIHAIQGNLQITGTTAKESASTFAGSFASMKSAFSNFLGELALGQDLGPSLTALAETLSTFLFQNLLPMIGNIVSQLPTAIITFAQAAGPLLIQAGTDMITQLTSGIGLGGPGMSLAITTFFTNVQTWISTEFPKFLQNGVTLITNLANGLLSSLPTVLTNLGTIISGLLGALMQAVPKLIDAGVKLIGGLAKGLLDNLPAIGKSMVDIVGKILQTLIDNLPNMVKSGFNAIGSMAKGLLDNLPTVITNITTILGDLIKTIAGKLPELLASGVKLIGELAVGLVQGLPDLLLKIPEIIKAIVDGILGLVGDFVSAGKDLLLGLGKGIADAVGGVIEGAIDAVGGIVDGVKDFFGINSPSRVFAEIGMFLDAGLANGIQDNMRPVEKAMDELGETATGAFHSDVAYDVITSNSAQDMRSLDSALAGGGRGNGPEKQPAVITLNLGMQSFKAFVKDITEVQESDVQMDLAYE